MKVLQIGKFYPPQLGGIETHSHELCAALIKNVQVKAVVANHEARTIAEVFQGVPVVRLANLATIASTPLCPSMFRAVRHSEADIVHLHLPNPLAVVAYLASGHQGKLVVSHHSDIVRQKTLGRLYAPLHRRALARCSAIIVASPNHIEYSEELQLYRHLCEVIPYGISLEQFSKRDEDAIKRIRYEHGPRIVLSVGRLVYYKGFDYLIHAMRSIDATLLIIGTGPLRKQLESQISTLGLEGRIRLVGAVSDVVPYYQSADVFVLPSVERSEAFGIVQLEAMACAVPVVNTGLASGVPFVSIHGETGFTVPPRDSEALSNAVNSLLSDTNLRRRMGMSAKLRVQSEFSAEMMGQRTLSLYRSLLAHTRHRNQLVVSPSALEPAAQQAYI